MRNKEPPAKSKMANGVWKWVKPQVIGHLEPLSLNKFLIRRRKMGKKWKKIMVKIAVH